MEKSVMQPKPCPDIIFENDALLIYYDESILTKSSQENISGPGLLDYRFAGDKEDHFLAG